MAHLTSYYSKLLHLYTLICTKENLLSIVLPYIPYNLISLSLPMHNGKEFVELSGLLIDEYFLKIDSYSLLVKSLASQCFISNYYTDLIKVLLSSNIV